MSGKRRRQLQGRILSFYACAPDPPVAGGAAVLEVVIASGRAVDEVAGAFAVAWHTVQATINMAIMTLPAVDDITVRLLGIDEHRFRTVRFFRDPAANNGQGAWKRVEPWMTTFVNLQTGQVIGVVDGRDTAAVATWLAARSPAWRDRVEVVAIDPSAAFRATVTRALPTARVSVDHFHLVQLANLMVTQVRQRVAREQLGHRGRKDNSAWAHRLLLLRAGDRLSPAALDRLFKIFAHGDPTDEHGAAWAVKERLRMLLATTDLPAADTARGLLGIAVVSADTAECWKLWNTINAWWTEIETFIETRVTNARTEAANTAIKQIKRTGRGYRNHDNYQARILLRSARQTRRRSPLNQQATTLNCGWPKNDPVRVLAIFTLRSPDVVETTFVRVPLRCVVLVSFCSCRAAPMCSVASASTSAWRIVWSRVRINLESSALRIASVNSSRADWFRVIASSLLS